MLHLPQVSVFSIDTVTPHRTLAAIEYSVRWVRFAEIIFLTDLSKFPNLPSTVHYKVPVRYVDHRESNRKVSLIPGRPPFLPIDYEMAAMREPSQHVKTSHYLRIEWDSAVVNHEAWDNDWLNYDMTGAPWIPHDEPGYPECDGETNAVGNAGFSLQSMKYARAVREATDVFKNDPEVSRTMINSDCWPCRVIRPWLEHERGIRFAPVDVAAKFSCENRIYAGAFGFHGRNTVLINGWAGAFFGNIKPK